MDRQHQTKLPHVPCMRPSLPSYALYRRAHTRARGCVSHVFPQSTYKERPIRQTSALSFLPKGASALSKYECP